MHPIEVVKFIPDACESSCTSGILCHCVKQENNYLPSGTVLSLKGGYVCMLWS